MTWGQGGNTVIAHVNGIDLYFDIESAGLVPAGNRMVARPPCFVFPSGPGLDHSINKPALSPLAAILQLIYVDERGNGRSSRLSPEEYTLENTVEDMEALRQYLGLQKVAVVGASYGGMVALQYAATYPENLSHVITISTAASCGWFEECRREAFRRATPEMKPELNLLFEARYENAEQMNRSFKILSPLFFEKDYELYRGAAEQALDRSVLSPEAVNCAFSTEIASRYDVRHKLNGIMAPTLILAGRHDWAMKPRHQELMHNLIPNSRLVVFEDCGHMVLIEARAEVLRAVKGFLSDTVEGFTGRKS
jgi:proline iminopeptidase